MGENVIRIRESLKYTTTLILSLVFTGCVRLDAPSPEPASTSGFPDQEFFGANILLSRAGIPRFEISAQHITRFEQIDLLLLKGDVEAHIYDENGHHSGIMTADEGDVIQKDMLMVARGNVIVRSDSGLVLYADTLYYDQDANQVVSDGFVTMVSQYDSLSGTGFSASPNLKDWEIKDTGGTTWRKLE